MASRLVPHQRARADGRTQRADPEAQRQASVVDECEEGEPQPRDREREGKEGNGQAPGEAHSPSVSRRRNLAAWPRDEKSLFACWRRLERQRRRGQRGVFERMLDATPLWLSPEG